MTLASRRLALVLTLLMPFFAMAQTQLSGQEFEAAVAKNLAGRR
jgi:hypothetical protein